MGEQNYMKCKWINEIKGFEKCGEGYKIYEDGSVVSYKKGRTIVDSPQRTLKQQVSKGTKGYCQVDLGEKTVKVHRLVALAFIPNPENKPQINHVDGDKTNNHVDNLEWCDNSENQIHAYSHGLSKPKTGDDNPYWENEEKFICLRKRRMVEVFDIQMNKIAEYKSLGDASRNLDIGLSTINRAMQGGYLCKKKYYFKEIKKCV